MGNIVVINFDCCHFAGRTTLLVIYHFKLEISNCVTVSKVAVYHLVRTSYAQL